MSTHYILRALASTLKWVTTTHDIGARARIATLASRNITTRLILIPAAAAAPRDVSCLLLLKIDPSTGIVLYPLPHPVGFRGIGMGPGVGQPADTVGGFRN